MNIKNLINKIENEKYSFLAGFIGLFSIITIRNIFESAFEGSQVLGFSPLTDHSFYMIFSHFPLFYISLFLWFLLIFGLLTKHGITKISKALLIGMWVIVITPFIDIIVSRGSGYKLTYLKGIEEFTQLHMFFDFTKDLLQTSWGQRIEILLALVGAFVYVCVKTRNILKSLITSVIFYLIIFFHGVLPNTIAQIPSYLGFSRLHFRTIISAGILGVDSQNYSIIFLISIIIIGLPILKKWRGDIFYQILNFRLSIIIIISMILGIIYAIFLIRPYFPFIFDSSIHYVIFLSALFSIHIARLTSTLHKSSTEFTLLTIFLIFATLAIGFTYFVIVLAYFILVNYIDVIFKKEIKIGSLQKYLIASMSVIFAFVAGFSVIFQGTTFSNLIPYDHQQVKAYGRKIAAWNYFINKDFDKAREQYEIVDSLDKNNEIVKRLGQSYLKLGHSDEGIKTLEMIKPLDYETVLSLGQSYIQMGKHKKVMSLYQDAIGEDIEPGEFITLLAQSFARRGLEAEMDSLLKMGIKYGMPRFQFYRIKGDYNLQTREYEVAIMMYNKALHYNPRAILAYAGKGLAYYSLGDVVKSEQEFLTALSVEPNNDVLNNNLGAIYLITKNYEKAKALFEKSISINPLQAEAYFNLGLIAEVYGQPDEALKMYVKSLEINPNFVLAQRALERLGRND